MKTQKFIIWQNKKTKNWIVCQGVIGFHYTVRTYKNLNDVPQEGRAYRKPTKEEIQAYNNDMKCFY